eukprot:TRINITY_DN1933_c0_g2_i1.p1 TRINITY_DN1933_c0_g2~~TRINITY_DN1933_c0_g2_i1.p1  ORF type:complete len:275 (+),score=93.40 TRINITY_DN1933_c0_g2_i1:29-853(+)
MKASLLFLLALCVTFTVAASSLEEADDLVFQGQFTDAANLFAERLQSGGDLEPAEYEKLAYIYYLGSEFDLGLQLVDFAIEKHSDLSDDVKANLYYWQARIYGENEEDLLSFESLKKTLELAPKHPSALYAFSSLIRRLSEEQEDYEGETNYSQYFELANEQEISTADHYEMKAMASMMNEDFVVGLEAVNKAIELSPARIFNYVNRCFLNIATEDYYGARVDALYLKENLTGEGDAENMDSLLQIIDMSEAMANSGDPFGEGAGEEEEDNDEL